jgi:hypothetical protein
MMNVLRRYFQMLPSGLQDYVRGIRRRIPLTAKERWISNVYTPFAFEERARIYRSIARFLHINRPITGYYFEFGSHEANTMRLAWDTFRHLFDFYYVAFDSFQGLPKIREIDRQEIWKEGKLSTSETQFLTLCLKHGMPADRLMTVRGFYDQSLTEELKGRLLPRKAAVIYVDCDLYHSTVPVLEFIKDFLQKGTVIVFDDWNCFWADPNRGERRAWREFCERYPELHFEEFITTSMQKAFIYIGSRADDNVEGSS